VVLLGTESADASSQHFGPDQRGFLTALDASTGSVLWTVELPNWIHGDPVVHQGRVFVTFGRFPMLSPGGVMTVDLKTGATLWSLKTEGGIMPAAAVDSVAESIVVAGGDSTIRTLDMRTGGVKNAGKLSGPVAMASPRIDQNGMVYLGAGASLVSYASRAGNFNWSFSPPDLVELGTPPVALADEIVFTEGTRHRGLLSAFRDLPFGHFLKLSREGQRLSGGRLSTYPLWFQEQWLLAVDRRDGHLLWQRPLGVGLIVLRNNSGTPVVTGQRVIISSPVSQTVFAFDARSGRMIWRRRLDAMHIGAVTIVGTDVLLGDKQGNVTLLRVEDGEILGGCSAGAPFSPTAPLVVGRTLFAATRDGMVYATPYDSLRSRAVARRGMACF
jgi:outer membrane protein assembly factor BamB